MVCHRPRMQLCEGLFEFQKRPAASINAEPLNTHLGLYSIFRDRPASGSTVLDVKITVTGGLMSTQVIILVTQYFGGSHA